MEILMDNFLNQTRAFITGKTHESNMEILTGNHTNQTQTLKLGFAHNQTTKISQEILQIL